MPLSGESRCARIAALFEIDQVDLQTPATKLKATGQFSFDGDSNLQVDLNSSDAAELQAVLISSGLLPEVEEQMRSYGIELAGSWLSTERSEANSARPISMDEFRWARCWSMDNDLGSLSASLKMTAAELRIDEWTIDREEMAAACSLRWMRRAPARTTSRSTPRSIGSTPATCWLRCRSSKSSLANSLADTQADASGQIKITGIPNAMSGSADLRFGPGRLAGEPLESLVARATFSGSTSQHRNRRRALAAGHIVASGNLQHDQQSISIFRVAPKACS